MREWHKTHRQLHWLPVRQRVVFKHPAVSGTGPLQPLSQDFGTVCRPTYEKPTCYTPGSGGRWRHFYLDSPTTAHCELYYLRRVEVVLLTYLHKTHTGCPHKSKPLSRIIIELY